eukprot:GFYU01000115.1.p1 GENE.GFYU01000115.1~~GFYU01000115.1.p1  ORF type:complete len:139 (-),score=20.64 GFYU01000115.1:57-473(-)
MSNLALASAGASIVMATSSDENHPAEHIINGNDEQFWVTTGMYPQEVIISLGAPAKIMRMKTLTTNVQNLVCEKSENPQPVNFERVFDFNIQDRNGRIQTEVHQVKSVTARYLKFIITGGYDDFATIHSIQVEGVTIN